jgi:hypothetical protein
MNSNALTVTFASSSGDAFYHVELLGDPVHKLTCTCPGYKNIQCCKHLAIILDGEPLPADPLPTDGYEEALETIKDSPVRIAYERLINGLLTIDEKILVLKSDAKMAKKMFYRMLSEGIN